jgi:LPXTG-motif cell wall-anchored protein
VVEVIAQQVGGVDVPPGEDTDNGSSGSGDGGSGDGGSGDGDDSDGDVAGEFLPHTGAGVDPLAIGVAGLAVLTVGGALVTRATRRRRVQIL